MKRVMRGMLSAVVGLVGYVVAADSAFVLVDDVVTVEAENLRRSSKWVKETSISGYTGSGYVRYAGPRQGPTYVPGQDELVTQSEDVDSVYQGSEADWLVIPVLITRNGNYHVNMRTAHSHTCFEPWCLMDGDLSVWSHAKGLPAPIKFVHGAPGTPAFKWLSYGPGYAGSSLETEVSFPVGPLYTLKQGVVEFYIAGRDVGFRIDRISIYRQTGPDQYPAGHCSNTLPQSAMTEVTSVARVESTPQTVRREMQGGEVTITRANVAGHTAYDLRGRSVRGSTEGVGAVVRERIPTDRR